VTQRISSFRHWVAWQLQKLSARIFDDEYFQRLRVYDPDGSLIVEWGATANVWGGGVHYQTYGTLGAHRVELHEFDHWDYDDDTTPTAEW
jgi:hypothetical protein